jgi:hypothetical protein
MNPLTPSVFPNDDFLGELYARLRRALGGWIRSDNKEQDLEDALHDASVSCLLNWPRIVGGAIAASHAEGRGATSEDVLSCATAYLAQELGRKFNRRQSRDRNRATDPEILAETLHQPRNQGALVDHATLLKQVRPTLTAELTADEIATLDCYDLPHAEAAARLGTTIEASTQRRKRLKQKLGRNDNLEAIYDGLCAARDGHYGSGKPTGAAIAARHEGASGECRPLELLTDSLRWHQDGFVRARVRPTAPLPDVTLGLAMLRPKHHLGATLAVPSAPFCLVLHDDDHGGKVAELAIYVGEPPIARWPAAGLPLPTSQLVVALAS